MTALLVVLAAWFGLSIPVALFTGRFIHVGQTYAAAEVPAPDPTVPATVDAGPRLTVSTLSMQR